MCCTFKHLVLLLELFLAHTLLSHLYCVIMTHRLSHDLYMSMYMYTLTVTVILQSFSEWYGS